MEGEDRAGRWGGRTERDFSPHIFIWSSYSLQAEAEVVQTDWRELKGRDVWQLVCPGVSPLNLEKVRVETGGVSVSILSSLWHFTCFTF